MSLALISLSKDTLDNSVPIGLLSLFDGYLLDQQVRIAIDAGAEQLILICPTMNGAVLQYVDRLQREGIDIQLVRSGKDLVQFAEPDGKILYVGDGILPGKTLIAQLAGLHDERIYVVNDADEYADFERIDINHRWLGVACLNAARLSGFLDLPEDWDVGSALLRGAVQSDCKRELMKDAEFADGAISYLKNDETVADYARDRLHDRRYKKSNFLERLIIWPLSRALLPRLWRNPNAERYMVLTSGFLSIMAGIVAYFVSSTVAPLALLIIAALLLAIRGHITLFSGITRRFDGEAIAGYSVIGLITLFAIIRESSGVTLAPNFVIFVLSCGTLILAEQTKRNTRWNWIKPQITLALIILLGFTAFDSFFAGLYFAALLGMLFLLGSAITGQRDRYVARVSAKK